MNGVLPLYDTRPIQKGDQLEEGSTVFRPIITSPNMGVFTVDGMRFGVFVQTGTVGAYKTNDGTPFCTFGGTLADPTASPHFRSRDEADAFIVEQIQQAREELLDQVAEVLSAARLRQEASNCCRTNRKGGCCDR